MAQNQDEYMRSLGASDCPRLVRRQWLPCAACTCGRKPKAILGELTPEDCARLGIKEWELSADAIAHLEQLDSAIVRPGDPRLKTIITG